MKYERPRSPSGALGEQLPDPFIVDDESNESFNEADLLDENPVFVLSKSPRQGWSRDEKEMLTHLRSVEKAKWADIAQALPGRSAASCRSQWHYQGQVNKEFREREKEKADRDRSRSEVARMEVAGRKESDWETCDWSEELKDEFAIAYERHKRQMWHPIALEMNQPWKSVEAWHWAMGQREIARRAAAAAAVAGREMASSHPDRAGSSIARPPATTGSSSSNFPVKWEPPAHTEPK